MAREIGWQETKIRFFAVESATILREARWRIDLLGLTNFQLYWLDWLEASRIEWSLL